MKNKLFLVSIGGAILCFALGMIVGWFVKPPMVIKTEFKTITEKVSVCDKAFTNYEKAVCFAQEGCRGTYGLDSFTYDGWKDKTNFSCKKYNWESK